MQDLSCATGHAGGFGFSLAEAARDTAPVKGLTHGHYRYPARFSPTFAQAAIKGFTNPGDWVVDPFAGGGTTLVEALALGRNALGIDISSLSAFVCEAKTQILKDTEIAAFQRWMAKLNRTINMHARACVMRNMRCGLLPQPQGARLGACAKPSSRP